MVTVPKEEEFAGGVTDMSRRFGWRTATRSWSGRWYRWIPPKQLAALRGGLPTLAIDSIPHVGLHLHEERPAAVIDAVRRASYDADSLARRKG